jgi:two-component system, OmpR family, KDP operon response regulator KdpE
VTARVLLVEDDRAMLRLIEVNLRARGYRVDLAATGASGLARATHPPDLIILDLGLPDLDGAELIASVRAWSRVPILAISARDDLRAADALRAGADDYLAKPFGIDKLVARVRAALCRAPGDGTGEDGQEGAEADVGCATMG